MDACIGHKMFFGRQVEESAMRDARLFCSTPRIDCPCVQVSVEVNNRDGAVHLMQGAQYRQDNGMIATQAIEEGQ